MNDSVLCVACLEWQKVPHFWMRPEVRLAVSDGCDAHELRDLTQVVAAHADLIERAWNEHFA